LATRFGRRFRICCCLEGGEDGLMDLLGRPGRRPACRVPPRTHLLGEWMKSVIGAPASGLLYLVHPTLLRWMR
jgi:hypothetical protein